MLCVLPAHVTPPLSHFVSNAPASYQQAEVHAMVSRVKNKNSPRMYCHSKHPPRPVLRHHIAEYYIHVPEDKERKSTMEEQLPQTQCWCLSFYLGHTGVFVVGQGPHTQNHKGGTNQNRCLNQKQKIIVIKILPFSFQFQSIVIRKMEKCKAEQKSHKKQNLKQRENELEHTYLHACMYAYTHTQHTLTQC